MREGAIAVDLNKLYDRILSFRPQTTEGLHVKCEAFLRRCGGWMDGEWLVDPEDYDDDFTNTEVENAGFDLARDLYRLTRSAA